MNNIRCDLCGISTQRNKKTEVSRLVDSDKPESMEDFVCEHKLCYDCLYNSLLRQINAKKSVLRCPVNESTKGCVNNESTTQVCIGEVTIYDLRRLDNGLAELYQQQLLSLERPGDPSTWSGCTEWEDDPPIQCPSCGVYIYPNGGCETIYCICSSVFCSQCLRLRPQCICTCN